MNVECEKNLHECCSVNMTHTSNISITIILGDDPLIKNHVIQNIEPMLFPFDPYTEIVHFDYTHPRELGECYDHLDENTTPTPAMAIMLFAPERGPVNAEQLKSELLKHPWSLHHTVILQKKSASMRTVGQQDFYDLSSELPLWSVCPTLLDKEYLRIHIFTKNFNKMVTFYTILTGVEMQSKKPGFCFFQLCSPSGQNVQISLKQCPSLQPFTLPNVVLSFKMNNVTIVRSQLKRYLTKVSRNVYAICDPDGNKIHLVDQLKEKACPSVNVIANASKSNGDKNHSDSQDSGLFSDYEQGANKEQKSDYRSEIRQEAKIIELCKKYSYTATRNDESDFEDPWNGSQYNVSVNPSQKYKVLPKKTLSVKSGLDLKKHKNNKDYSQNDDSDGKRYSTKCKKCGFSDSELPMSVDSVRLDSPKYYQLEFEQIGTNSDYSTYCSMNSEKYHILPDEVYNGIFNRYAPRSKSLDMASIKSFRKAKSKSMIQMISDRLLSRGKKLQWASLNSVAFENQQLSAENNNLEQVSEDIWLQNPKLFSILGPPEKRTAKSSNFKNQADSVKPKNCRAAGNFSNRENVNANDVLGIRKKSLVAGRKVEKTNERNSTGLNQIGSLVCPSSE